MAAGHSKENLEKRAGQKIGDPPLGLRKTSRQTSAAYPLDVARVWGRTAGLPGFRRVERSGKKPDSGGKRGRRKNGGHGRIVKQFAHRQRGFRYEFQAKLSGHLPNSCPINRRGHTEIVDVCDPPESFPFVRGNMDREVEKLPLRVSMQAWTPKQSAGRACDHKSCVASLSLEECWMRVQCSSNR